MHSTFTGAVARCSFASAKDGSQNVRDNNAARVAGPGRICFFFHSSPTAFHPPTPPMSS